MILDTGSTVDEPVVVDNPVTWATQIDKFFKQKNSLYLLEKSIFFLPKEKMSYTYPKMTIFHSRKKFVILTLKKTISQKKNFFTTA